MLKWIVLWSLWLVGCRLLFQLWWEDPGGLQTGKEQPACWMQGRRAYFSSETYAQAGEKEETLQWFLVYHRDHIQGLNSFLWLMTHLGQHWPLVPAATEGPTAQAPSDSPSVAVGTQTPNRE